MEKMGKKLNIDEMNCRVDIVTWPLYSRMEGGGDPPPYCLEGGDNKIVGTPLKHTPEGKLLKGGGGGVDREYKLSGMGGGYKEGL